MNSKVLFNELVKAITIDESIDEIQAIAYIILENSMALTRTDILTEREIHVRPSEEKAIKDIVARINNFEPIQYIYGESTFFGRTFKVDSSVLIPRPETEELVELFKKHFSDVNFPARILDVGTGSGCIAVTLALEFPGSKVFATDVSGEALETASYNALRLDARVKFLNSSIINDDIPVGDLNAVVSNPPYIPVSEMASMKNNVTRFEPSLALFVSDEDPLIFYKALARKAYRAVVAGGLIAVEINERFGQEVARLATEAGFINVEILKDVFGKERIVKGLRP
jgi:release factor glutamine methyltransferase